MRDEIKKAQNLKSAKLKEISNVPLKINKNQQNPLRALGAVAPCTNCH